MKKINNISITKMLSQCLLVLGVMTVLSAPVAGSAAEPVDMLRGMTEQLIEIVERNPEILDNPEKLRAIASDIVLPHVDFKKLSSRVLGKYWRKATEAQQVAFAREFRELLLGTYVRSVTIYKDNTIRFLPSRRVEKSGRAVVKALIEQNNGPTVHTAFRLHRVDSKWLIYDFIVEGISLVATHRSTFSQAIHNHGIENLIEKLAMKNKANLTNSATSRK